MPRLDLHHEHAWNLEPSDAARLQQELASYVVLRDSPNQIIETVAGVDVGFPQRDIARAAVVVLNYADLRVIASEVVEQAVGFPYVPGLLSFREIPAVLSAVKNLAQLPDLFICDAQGFAHPRRFGLACHLGLLLNRPSIGAAKSRLVGTYTAPEQSKGSRSKLMMGKHQLGWVLRTRTGVKPLFVSPGHRLSFASAARHVLACTPRYRLPETTRQADKLASNRT